MPTTINPGEVPDSTGICGLLDAKRTYHLGTFRVRFRQIEFHRHQRLLDLQWRDRLRQGMEEGVDREQYPIQAILRDDETWQEHGGVLVKAHGSEFLPDGIVVIVYDGRHRVEAWKECAGSEQDKWWYTTIYRQALETERPGEFYSMMHAGNETESRKPHGDPDRFLLVHRLRCLLQKGQIDSDTYRNNAKRIMGPSGSTARSAIPSLVRSASVSASIANLVEYPELRPTFSASGWKKLTEGRLYLLVEWILEEAHEQFKLLKGSTLEADPAAFTLPASQCRWEVLEKAVGKADHPWNSLDGGAQAALARVRHRPAHRVLLNPLDCDLTERNWTFPDRVLLPSVLTSNIVTDCLSNMKNLSQHLVHIIAGPHALRDYCSKQAKDSEECSPGGYITEALGDRAFYQDGRPKNFAGRVVHHMWSRRDKLNDEIHNMMLTKPLETSVAEYQQLIDEGETWSTLLSLFKMKRFPQGLDISVRVSEKRTNAPTPPSSGSSKLPASGSQSTISSQASSHSGSLAVAGANLESEPATAHDPTVYAGLALESEKDAFSDALDGRQSSPREEDVASQSHEPDGDSSSVEKILPSQVKDVAARRKRKRVEVSEESAEDDGGYQPSPSELRALVGGVCAGEAAEYGHRGLNASMKRLENKARNLEREQARAMSDLIEALLEVPPSKVFMNVAKRLKDEIPRLTRKALKLVKNDYEDDEEEEETVPPSLSEEQVDRVVSTREAGAGWRRDLVRLIGDSETEAEQNDKDNNGSD